MEHWYYFLATSSLIASLTHIIKVIIKEVEKRKRIKLFSEMNKSQIEAIGQYEEKSKNEYLYSRSSKKSYSDIKNPINSRND